MKRILLTVAAVAAICLDAGAQNEGKQQDMGTQGKTLVAYFSATGTTERAARKIAASTGGDLYEITPETEYSSANLNWNDRQSRSSVEMADPEARPVMKGPKADVSGYDTIYIGYPIWWDLAPRIINTFIESHNLGGKTIIPFATCPSACMSGFFRFSENFS